MVPCGAKRCSADRRLDLQVCITCIMQARLFSERVKCACFRFRARFPQVPGRLNLRHDLRAWSSLRLDPKLPRRAVPDGLAGEIDWLRVDPARDSLFCFQPFLLFLILSLSSFVSPFSSRARPSSSLPLPLHFTSSRHLSHLHITPAVFTSSLHITAPPSTSLS